MITIVRVLIDVFVSSGITVAACNDAALVFWPLCMLMSCITCRRDFICLEYHSSQDRFCALHHAKIIIQHKLFLLP